ncbi:MAG: cation:proton antiporter [Bacteroidetes bacterium]|nr:cation:proton antiporter [Bacteroidota bacterium]
MHLSAMIYDLALILGVAAVVTVVFKMLKQPVVLGYIVAGLVVGPNIAFFPTVIEIEGIKTWAEIGVLFLLFGLGLEFSFKKLARVGGVAMVTALTGVVFTLFSGYLAGLLLGWGNMDSLFLGGILAIASTTIIIRAFDELGVKSQQFAGIVLGVLVIEDLVAVVLMVILSTVSVSRSFEGVEMLMSVFKLIFFLVIWFIAGIYFLPTLFKALRRYLNDETLLIFSVALCFLMVVLASRAGFSSALGAFIMGSVLAETTKAERIEQGIKSLKNLFGAIFFVSVGMLIDPAMLSAYFLPILTATLILLIGKPFFVICGALLAGQPLKVSVQSGMSLSQIGEFSFIIATLGLTLNVTSAFLYPIAVAVSVLTTFTTPFMIRLSEPAYHFIERKLPRKWKRALNNYGAGAQKISVAGDWKKLLRFYAVNVIIFAVIIITIILLVTTYVYPLLNRNLLNDVLLTTVTLLVLSPFLWALAFRRTDKKSYTRIWEKPVQRGPLIMLMLSRVFLAIFFIGFLFQRLFSPAAALGGVVIASAVVFIFRKRIKGFYGKIEYRFLSNLNERETLQRPKIQTPWDSHLTTYELSPALPFIGQTLREVQFREKFGVNVAMIKRGDQVINVPGRNERLYPNDVLSLIGSDKQLEQFMAFMNTCLGQNVSMPVDADVALHQFQIGLTGALIGKTIRSSAIRELSGGLVVGVERNGKRLLNPESDFVFQANDTVWMVADESRLKAFLTQNDIVQ